MYKESIEYNDEAVEEAINEIESFAADFGGT